ncbi:MAG: reverse transcriptase domain-containing protein [Fusobacteriaceae bacterium]
MDLFSIDNRSFGKYRSLTLKEISKLDNIYDAYLKVKKKNKGPGINNTTLSDISEQEIYFLSNLSKILENNSYIPKVVKLALIKKKNGKNREIGILCLEDRIIQNAILSILGPIFENEFLKNSFAYRKNISYIDAIEKVRKYLDEGYHYILDLDIEGFFDNIDHELLKKILTEKIKDPELIILLNRFLNQGIYYSGNIFKKKKGVIQGAPLSPFYSNIYLHKFDLLLNKSNITFVRYADDFLVLLKNNSNLKDVIVYIEDILSSYKLNLNYEKCRVIDFRKTGEVEFLGQKIYKSR